MAFTCIVVNLVLTYTKLIQANVKETLVNRAKSYPVKEQCLKLHEFPEFDQPWPLLYVFNVY